MYHCRNIIPKSAAVANVISGKHAITRYNRVPAVSSLAWNVCFHKVVHSGGENGHWKQNWCRVWGILSCSCSAIRTHTSISMTVLLQNLVLTIITQTRDLTVAQVDNLDNWLAFDMWIMRLLWASEWGWPWITLYLDLTDELYDLARSRPNLQMHSWARARR